MSSARIFVIWDDIDLTKMFTIFFAEYGYVTHSAHSFDDGFAACLDQPPDILIVPRTMTNQDDGLEFCQQVRATASLTQIPLIVGYADLTPSWLDREEAYQQAYETGVNACFGRVFNPTDVLEQVEILLANPMTTNLVDRQTLRLSQKRARK